MPLPKRWLTALMTRYNGSSLLIDCGEGITACDKRAGMEFSPDRCDLFYTLSCRPYQRTAWTASYNGKCGQNRASHHDWTKRT